MSASLLIRGIGVLAELVVTDGELGPEQDALLADELRRVWARCLVNPATLRPDETPETTVRLQLTNDAEPTASTLDQAFAANTLDEPQPDDEYTVVAHDIEALLTSATQTITRALLARRIGRRLLLHAGCVAHPVTGKALAFAAGGGTGKTTLTIGLSKRYSYVTDETLCVNADGDIAPYPKPLSVVGAGRYYKAERSPDELGLASIGAEPLLVGLVLLRRDPEATDVTVEDLPLLTAIEELVPQSSSIHRLPEPLHAVANIIDLVDGVQRWTYSEWETLEPLVEARLGTV